MKIAMTGANGFIGKALTNYLRNQGHTVIKLVHPEGKLDAWSMRIDFIQELVELPALLELHKGVDAFIHLAWAGSYGDARTSWSTQLKNLTILENSIKLASLMNAKKFIGIGTITEKEIPFVKLGKDLTPPASYVYGVVKDTARKLMYATAANLGLESNWVQLGNVYGPNDDTDRFLINLMKAASNNQSMHLSSCKQLADFVHIDDTVEGIEKVCLNGVDGETYYLGSGKQAALRYYVDIVYETSGTFVKPFFDENKVTFSIPWNDYSIYKAVKDIGYEPFRDFRESMVELLKQV